MLSADCNPEMYPYSPRNGVNTTTEAEMLFAEPAFRLSVEEKAEAQAFARGLSSGVMGELTCDAVDPATGEIRDYEALDKISPLKVQHAYSAPYFETDEGRAKLEKLGVPTPDDGDVLSAWRAAVATGSAVDKKARRQASADSMEWRRTQIAEQLGQPAETDADFIDPGSENLNFDPDILLDKFGSLQAYRTFYRKVRAQLGHDGDTHLWETQNQLLNQHVVAINYQTAKLYPLMCSLAEQLRESPGSPLVDHWQTQLEATAPVLKPMFASEHPVQQSEQSADRFSHRLDMFRFGAVQAGPRENFSAISPEVRQLDIDLANRASHTPATAIVSEQTIATMEQTSWKAGEFKSFLETVLDEYDLRSSVKSSWEELADRQGAASDGKWQVVISPKVFSLTVNSRDKVMLVPQDFDRSLIGGSVQGALPLGAHEVTHVLQAEFREQLAADLPLARYGSRRATALAEMGGIVQEREFLADVGIERPSNMFYLRGQETRESGGNVAQVARAILESRSSDNPTAEIQDDLKTRKSRAGMALRLYRAGGHHSQPMDYVEQRLMSEVIARQSPERVRAVSIGATALALMDSAALHAVDMFELPDVSSIESPAKVVMRVYLEQTS